MKKTNFLLIAMSVSTIAFLSSCSDDTIECHECHIAYEDGVNPEVEVEIGEFCGAALEEVEAPGYTHTIEETIVGMDTVPAGTYGNGNMEIHCEEHADN